MKTARRILTALAALLSAFALLCALWLNSGALPEADGPYAMRMLVWLCAAAFALAAASAAVSLAGKQ